jgi:hypothetical protein
VPSPRKPVPGAAQPRSMIAVGTLIAKRPPHRSEHARLRQSAPTLVFDGEACVWPRMKDAVIRSRPLFALRGRI